MSSDFDPLLWFVCKICRQAFPDTEKLKKHQIRKHAEDCKNVKCIVFEERLFDKQWIPSDNYFPESNFEFTNENLIEVAPVTFKCGCHCHSISAVSVPAETQTESYLQPPKHKPNPYVLVTRLTFVELNAAKAIFQSRSGPEERKRKSRGDNHDDVQSPNKKKRCFNHQQNQNHKQNVCTDVNPELFPGIVTPKSKSSRNAFSKQISFSSFSPVSDPSGNVLADVKHDPNMQCVEEMEKENQLVTEAQISDFQNCQIQKIESSTSTSTLTLPFLSDFGNINRTQVAQVNVENESLCETNNLVSNPITNDVYYSDSEHFEIDDPASPDLSDDIKITGEQDHLSFASNVSEIKANSSESKTARHLQFNLKLNQQEVYADTNSSSSASLNATTSNNNNGCPDSISQAFEGEKLLQYSTRGTRNKSKINYSESHICSNCSLDFDTLDDLQDHQRLCTQNNRFGSIDNRNNRTSPNRRNKNSEDLVIHINSDDDSEPHASKKPPNTYGGEINRISSRADDSKIKKSTSAVTDGDSDYDAAGDENISESDSDHYIPPADVPLPKLPKKDTTINAPTATISQYRKQLQLNKNSKEDLTLLKWLETQKEVRFPDGTKNIICLFTLNFSPSKCLGTNNYIMCELCKLMLTSKLQVMSHVANCWLHNQSNHCYCVPCAKRFGNPQNLANHFQKEMFTAKHDCFRRSNGPHVLEANTEEITLEEDHQIHVSVNDTDLHPTDPVSNINIQDFPLPQWLKIQKKNPDNVVALEPDPFETSRDRNIPVAPFTVSESSPVKCKLCHQLLTSEILLRNHVETCWTQNKAKHRYCVLCNKTCKSYSCLRAHQRRKQCNVAYQKQKQISSWSCTVCRKDMGNTLLFHAHQESLRIFLAETSQTESRDFPYEKNPHVESTKIQYIDIPGQEGTMKNLLGWLKHTQTFQNSDDTSNLVLIDSETATNSSGELDKDNDLMEINEANPITCRLCLEKLTKFDHVQVHVKTCWSQNKEKHRYCVTCEKGFDTPTELQEHRTSEHSAPKNIVLFYREDEGDGSLLNVDGLEVNSDNPVTCKLCKSQLGSTPEVKIHGENCWFHNRASHVYCIICDRGFEYKYGLRTHYSQYHRRLKPSRPSADQNIPADNMNGADKTIPLRQWLIIQKEDPKNVVALEPDPSTPGTVTVSESSPVKCKLCSELLITEKMIKTHVASCWLHNKGKHCYCGLCHTSCRTNYHLLAHNDAKHRNHPTNLLICLKCNQEFLTESELAKHTKSLQEFQRQRKNYAVIIPTKKVDLVNNCDGSSWNTMAYAFEWLNHLRQIKNVDGTENIILVDPEPTADNFKELSPENPITCRLCQQKYINTRGLNAHVRDCWTLHKDRHRFCVICEKLFDKPRRLQNHTMVEHLEVTKASFICKFCGQEFVYEVIFKEHQKSHKDPTFLPFNCPHCSLAFKDKNDLLKHVTAVHRGREKVAAYKCKLCPKSFTERNLLNNHNRSAHTGERPFKCKFPNCSYAFHNTATRQAHYHYQHREEMGLEPQQFLCPTCGKTFTQKILFTNHLKKSHTLDKPLKCTYEGCTKAFKANCQLTEHARDHTGEKPYVCEECGQAFARLWSFTKHKRSHEGTLNRAQCHLCPRKFLGGWELKQHLKIHGERKEFKCQFCEVQCATLPYLKIHEKTHGNKGSDDKRESSTDSDV